MRRPHPHPRGRTAAAVACLAALVVSAVAAVPAPAQLRQAPLRATGALTITWQGSPARGCASGAPCDVVGSAVLALDARGTLVAFRRNQFFADLFESRQRSPVVRVRRRGADPAGPVCVDTGGSAGFGGPGVSVEPAQAGRVRIALRPGFDAGRCAGPLAADVRPALPRVTADAHALRRGAQTISLRGSRRFAAGPFTGTVASSVVLRVGTLRARRSFGVPPPRRAGRRGRRAVIRDGLRLSYGVTVRGTLTASFRGLAAPECELLDACGVSGRTSLTPVTGGGRRTITFTTAPTRRARGGDRPTVAALVRRVRAGGRRLGGASGRIGTARVSGTARREGNPFGCAEEAEAGPLGTLLRQERGERDLTLELIVSGSDLGGAPSSLRTRCPGPAAGSGFGDDLGSDTPVAAGRLALAEVGRRALTVRLSARGGEVAAGYAVTRRRGEIVVRLRRRSASVYTVRGDGSFSAVPGDPFVSTFPVQVSSR